ncbi:MAG: hypothetical protein ACJ789_06325 [Thermomicrobiales bacterium]
MVTRSVDDVRTERAVQTPVRNYWDETKISFLTTEFWAFIAAVVGVAIATQQLDNLDAWDGWRLITALAIGYMLSRGLAKAGSAHPDEH